MQLISHLQAEKHDVFYFQVEEEIITDTKIWENNMYHTTQRTFKTTKEYLLIIGKIDHLKCKYWRIA
jgi:hypothetical protein